MYGKCPLSAFIKIKTKPWLCMKQAADWLLVTMVLSAGIK